MKTFYKNKSTGIYVDWNIMKNNVSDVYSMTTEEYKQYRNARIQNNISIQNNTDEIACYKKNSIEEWFVFSQEKCCDLENTKYSIWINWRKFRL